MNLGDKWLILDETESTQDIAAALVRKGQKTDVVFTHHQSQGRGRLGRSWESHRGQSLTVSLVLWQDAGHPRPWLLGMAVAVAASEILNVQVQWPNDLVFEGKKLGGVLTELIETVPVVGLGVNLNQTEFPEELARKATSLKLANGKDFDALETGQGLVARLQEQLPVENWSDLAVRWSSRDATSGKAYKCHDGDVVIAQSVGANGELLAMGDNGLVTLLAADAWFGP